MSRPLSVAFALCIATSLAACGERSSLTPEKEVRTVVSRFAVATAEKDYQAICDDLFSPALADNTEQYGLPCELALKKGFEGVVTPKLAIRGITVKGDNAKVRVHSTAANQPASDDVLSLARDGGAWRITALGAAPSGRAGGTQTTTTG